MADGKQREVKDVKHRGLSEADFNVLELTCFNIFITLLYSTPSYSTSPLLILPLSNNLI